MKFGLAESNRYEKVASSNQSVVFYSLMIILFGAMTARLFWLQIVQGSFYKRLSDENRIRLVSRAPIRGRILDRKGKILADNSLSYTLSVQPRLLKKENWPSLRDRLSSLLNLPKLELDERYRRGLTEDPFRIILVRNLAKTKVLRFIESQQFLNGAQLDEELLRYYPNGRLASHVLGYTQPITQNEFTLLSNKGYEFRDRIGRTGVEAAYESHLRGKWGGEMLEVDASGIVQRSLGIRPAMAGNDLLLTIDLELQKAAENALEDKRAGAMVVLDPRTGAIRAMSSRPNFNPNFFSKSFTSQKEYDDLFLSSRMPLFSRAVNAYDPGSTWKPITAIAGMETGKFPSDVLLDTAPCLKYGSHCFREHNGRGFGKIGYEDALSFSSNTFFYQIGIGVGSKALYDAATKLGFDSLTGIEISYEENKGVIGNEDWAKKGRGWGKPGQTPWLPEDMASAAIGQAVIQITPLQLARAYAVFANGGYLITPHLSDGGLNWTSSKYRKKVDIETSTLDVLRRGLLKVVESGTGASLNLSDFPLVAGKTGTAEDSTGGSDHAWFVCFAPYDSPEIVIVAFAQNTPGGGSVHALPMARKVLEVWNKQRGK